MKQLYPTRHPLLNQSQDVIHELAVDKNIALIEAIKVFNRRAEVVITSMRIGHIHLTYSYHLEPPHCDTTLTVPHNLHDCGLFIVEGQNMGKINVYISYIS
jgi:hypothetical protein